MAYIQPMVMVYQEYAKTSTSTATADLLPCIIGPCYHIIDPDENETLAQVGKYYGYPRTDSVTGASYPAGFLDKLFPNSVAGCKIQPKSIEFRFKNVLVRLDPNRYLIDSVNSTRNKLVFSSAVPTFLAIGDVLVLQDVRYRVIEINFTGAQKFILLDRTIQDVVSATYYSSGPGHSENSVLIFRLLEDYVCNYVVDSSAKPWVKLTGCTVDINARRFSLAGITIPVFRTSTDTTTSNCLIYESELYVGYRALRTDLVNGGHLQDVNEIEGKLGKIHHNNPLAFGVNVCLSNTQTNVMYIGVDRDADFSDDDEDDAVLSAYTAAKDVLENYDPVYCIVPLTTDVGVLTMFKNHCIAMSDPEESRWRICIGSSILQTQKEIEDGKGVVYPNTNGKMILFNASEYLDAAGNYIRNQFVSNGVTPGDLFILQHHTPTFNGGTSIDTREHVFTIDEVSSEDILKIQIVEDTHGHELTFTSGDEWLEDPLNPGNSTTVFDPNEEYTFRILRKMDKTEQAETIADVSRSYNSSRYVHVWPDKCTISGVEECPGYYLACAVAGGVGGLAPHYGFTNLSMAGISAVEHSSDYFSKTLLNTIADGGTFIFVQSSPAAAPYVRHQLTTDRSTVEFQELSFVKNFDYVSYICRDVMAPFIGTWNINENTLV